MAVCPAETVAELVDVLTLKSVPFPDKLSVCGLFDALSTMVTAAVRLAATVGLKLTVILQLAPAARLAPQLSVLVKSPGLAPARTMLLMVSAPLPPLLKVAL